MNSVKSISDKTLFGSTGSSFHHSQKSTKHASSVSQDFSTIGTFLKTDTQNGRVSAWKVDSSQSTKLLDKRGVGEPLGKGFIEKPKTSYSQNRLKMLINPAIPELSEIKGEMRGAATASSSVRPRTLGNNSMFSVPGESTKPIFPGLKAHKNNRNSQNETTTHNDLSKKPGNSKLSIDEEKEKLNSTPLVKRMTTRRISLTSLQQLNGQNKHDAHDELETTEYKISISSDNEKSMVEETKHQYAQHEGPRKQKGRTLTRQGSDGNIAKDVAGITNEKFLSNKRLQREKPDKSNTKGHKIGDWHEKFGDNKSMQSDKSEIKENKNANDDSFDIFGNMYGLAADPKVMKLKKQIWKFKVANKIVSSLSIEQHGHPLTSLNKGQDQRENYESALTILRVLVEVYKEALGLYKDRERLENLVNKALLVSTNSKNVLISLYNMKFAAKISYKMQNIFRSLSFYNECKQIAEIHKQFYIALKCCKGIGFCYQHLKLYQKAMSNFIKMLHIAWFLDQEAEELVAYDCLGMQYFYMGDLAKARYYHRRMMNGETEGHDSSVKILGVSKYKNHLLMLESKLLGLEPHRHSAPFVFEDFEANFPFTHQLSEDEEDELPMSEAMGGEIIKKPSRKKKKINLSYGYRDLKDMNFTQKPASQKGNGKLLLMLKEKDQNGLKIGNVAYKKADAVIQTLLKSKLKQSMGFSSMKLKDKIMVAHLSPNRIISKYQVLIPKVYSLKHFQLNEHTYNNVDINKFAQVEALIKKFAENLSLCVNKIEFILKKAETNMPGRKQGLKIDKRRRSSLGLL